MRRTGIALLIIAVALTACGCAVTGEVENQAYALVMGVDIEPDGGIGLTIRIPRIGQGDSGEGEESMVLSASGGDYAQALENLQWAAARELNLSHLELLMVSEALASDARFPALIREIAETRHLYTTAAFIVCEGRAKAFIEGQQTLLGSRLSDDIDAMLRHYAAHGFIPKATFAELYCAALSGYSDPVGIWGFPDSGERPAAAVIETGEATLNAETDTASSRQYLGAALFRDGQLVGRLDGAETLGLNLLTGKVNAFAFEAGGRAWMLASTASPKVSARLDGDKAQIRVAVSLTCADEGDLTPVKAAVERALREVVEKCQSLRTEPFGFAARLTARFATLRDWLDYDWRSRFPEAEVDIEVRVSGPA